MAYAFGEYEILPGAGWAAGPSSISAVTVQPWYNAVEVYIGTTAPSNSTKGIIVHPTGPEKPAAYFDNIDSGTETVYFKYHGPVANNRPLNTMDKATVVTAGV